jgi:GlcNAc-P-P-Und epimerase
LTCDLIGQLTGRPLPISSVRVKKYASSTQFAANRALESGFQPRHSLREALVDTIRHEFVAAPDRAPSAAPQKP